MFFAASKIVWFLIAPLNFVLLCGAISLILGRLGFRRVASFLGMACISFGLIIGFTQLPDLLLQKLEARYPYPNLKAEPHGIIVLGGGIEAFEKPGPHDYRLQDGSDRLIMGLVLKQQFPAARLIFSGGNANLFKPGAPEADAVRLLTKDLFGQDFQIELESNSRSTWENAVEVAKMINPEEREMDWVLITSAWHMPRALGAFRKQDLYPIPYATDYSADDLNPPFLAGRAITQFGKFEIAVKEYIGILAYWLSGKLEPAKST